MKRAFYYSFKVYTKTCLLTASLVSAAACYCLGENNNNASISSLSTQLSIVADTSDNLMKAERLWASINFNQMESEIRATLNLSLMDGTLFWDYLQPAIYQDQLNFLNGGYKSVTTATLPQYVAGLKQSYINLYSQFVSNKAAFMQQLAEQNSNNKVQQVNGPCVNMDFSSGTTNGWTTYKAKACNSNNQTPCTITAGANPRITIKTAGTDPFVPAIPMVPPGATFSLMLEDYLNGKNASRISQTFLVTPNNNVLTYKYAAVLEDPGHPKPESPYFKVNLSTQSGVDIPCGDYTAIAFPPIENFDSIPTDKNVYQNSDPVNSSNIIDIYYRNWTTVSIPLDKYMGQNVTITFTASDCALGGHRGYAYIWAECSSIIPFNDNYICLSETLSYTAPSGFAAYKWTGPGIVGRSDTITVQVDKPGAYSLILTPVADNPCPDTVLFNVLEHCAPKPVKDTVCETVQGTGKASGIDLTTFNSKMTYANTTGTVQGWYSGLPASSANLISNPTNYTVSNGGKYYAVITYPSIGGDTAELDFVVNSLPVITIPPIGPLCASNTPYQITGVTPAGGKFSGTNVTATGAFTPSAAGSYTITYTYTNANGCTNSAKQTIVVNPPPTVSASGQTVCSTVTGINLSGTVTNASGQVWTGGSGKFSNDSITNPVYTPSAAELAGISIKLDFIALPLSGCKPDTQKIIISVIQAPHVSVKDTTVCSSVGSITIARDVASNYSSLIWSAPSGSFNNTSILNPVYTPTITSGSVILTLTAKANSPCVNASATMKVTVMPPPKITATDTTICFTTPYVTTNATATDTSSVHWTATGGTFSNPNTLKTIYTPGITSGTVTLTLTANGYSPCASVTTTAKVTVIAPPKITVADTTICSTVSSITINTAQVQDAASVLWSAGSGSFNSTSSLTTTYTPSIKSGVVKLALTGNANAPCANVTDTMKVTVVPAPKISVTDTTICATTPYITTNATASDTASILWSAPSGTFQNSKALATIYTPAIPSGKVQLILLGKANSPCANVKDSLTVTVIAPPKIIVADTTICSTVSSITINTAQAQDAASVLWSAGSGSFNSTSSLTTIYTPSIKSGVVKLALTGNANAPCANVTDTMKVTVVLAPKISVTDTTICATTPYITTNATASNTASILWSAPSGTFQNSKALATIYTPAIPSGKVQLILLGKANSPCANVKDSLTVTVIAPPTVNAGTDTSLCPSVASINLQGSGTNDSTVTWTTSGSGSFSTLSNLNSLYTFTPAEVSSGKVILSVSALGFRPCAAVSDSLNVFFYVNPVVNAGPDQTICTGANATLPAMSSPALNYQWLTESGVLITTKDTAVITANSDTAVVLKGTDAHGCSMQDTVNVSTVTPPTFSPGGPYCYASGLTINSNPANIPSVNATIQWYQDDKVIAGANGYTLPVTDSGVYTIRFTYLGCTDSGSAIVYRPPVLITPHDTIACQGAPVVLSTAAMANAVFNWTDASGNALGSNSNILNVTAGTTGVKYFVKVTDIHSCSASDSAVVTGVPLPIVTVSDTSFCTGQSGPMGSYVANAAAIAPYSPTYLWVKNNKVLSTQQQLQVNAAGWYNLTVSARGCIGSDSGNVILNPLPVVGVPSELKYCEDTASYVVIDAGNSGSTYLWQPGQDTVKTIQVSNPGTYTVIVTNKYGCSSSAQTIVRLVCPPRLYISNAFSPNSDGSNDVYNVYSAHVGTFHMFIFNRWGEIIFESKDKNYFWNGIYREEPMPIGVYPWEITYEGDSEEYKGPYNMKGSVTVVR